METNFFIVAGMLTLLLILFIRWVVRKVRRRSLAAKKSKIIKEGFEPHKVVSQWRCCKKCGQWWHQVAAYKWAVSDPTVNDPNCICHTVKDA